ncbi:MAG: hypothetical protein Q9182_002694 [Xanthomendoza sp. 2 TL-2023]
MLANLQLNRRSYSLDSGLDSFQLNCRATSGLIQQNSLTSEELWNSYFDGDDFTYQGLDIGLIQFRAIESEAYNPLHHGKPTTQKQENLEHSIGNYTSALQDASEDSLGREYQPPELVPSDVLLEVPDFSAGIDFASMTKRTIINDSTCWDGLVSPDRPSHSLSSPIPERPTLRQLETHNKEEEGKEFLARYGGKVRPASPIGSHSQKALLDSLKEKTEKHLRAPLTPVSSGTFSEDGFPLNVEVAKDAYDQGLLSTGAFYRDCLPPALSIPKNALTSSRTTEGHGPSNGASESCFNYLSPPVERDEAGSDISGSVIQRRNLPHEAQLRRVDQAPLSAIYEEPAASQHACACGLCSHSEGGRGIVWFHLCPRFVALARDKGAIYEPCEGRIIMHHGVDFSSVGLIIEGPMEHRFVPASIPQQEPDTPASDKVKSPKPGKFDLRSLHSATNRPVKTLPRTSSGSRLHQLPPISTATLQRPISPATQVLHPTLLIPLSSPYCPEGEKSKIARKVAHISKGAVERSPAMASEDFQENIHPALRTGLALPEGWTNPPSRNESRASLREDTLECPPTPDPESPPRRSSMYSNFSGERPARSDSLGALAHHGLAEKLGSYIDDASDTREPLKTAHARQLTSSSISAPLYSPSAGHQRTPSVFLGPSTPSTTSFQRSSISSYGDPLLVRTNQRKEARLSSPFQAPDSSYAYDPADDDLSPEQSYYTAQDSQYAHSPSPQTTQTGYTSIASFDRLRSPSPRRNSPFFESQGYHRYHASELSIAQTFDSLQLQREDTNNPITSTTNLLNGSAFDSAETMTQPDAGHFEEHDNAAYDRLYLLDDLHDRRSKEFADPLLTASTHRTDDIFANPKPNYDSPTLGLGISISTPTSIHTHQRHRHQKPLPPLPPPHIHTNPPNEELENHLSRNFGFTTALAEPVRYSSIVQQNPRSHAKLQHVLGLESAAERTESPKGHRLTTSLAMTEVLRKGREGGGEKFGFVKKGSLMFREKTGGFLTEKVKRRGGG